MRASQPDLSKVATRAIIWVNDLKLDFTVIAVSKGDQRSYVKTLSDEYSHHYLTFAGTVADPELGRFTSWSDTIRALISWADRSGHTLEIYHTSEDGQTRIDVNPQSI